MSHSQIATAASRWRLYRNVAIGVVKIVEDFLPQRTGNEKVHGRRRG